MMVARGANVHVFCGSPLRQGAAIENGYTVHRITCVNGNDFKEKLVPFFAAQHQQLSFDLAESPEINSNALLIKKMFPNLPLAVRLHAPGHLVESTKKQYYPFSAKMRFVLGGIRRGKLELGYWRRYDFTNDPDYQFCMMADTISAPSQAMKHWIVKQWKIEEKNIFVIPNPFTPPKALLQLPIPIKKNRQEVVFFGRLNVLKGLVNATLAMKKILKEFPAVHFKVIGDDGPGPVNGTDMRTWMQEQLKGVQSQVSFYAGFDYDKLPAAIADATIALLPSLFESFSYTCAEAMAAGKAVIGSKDTGMDFIKHNRTGLLVNAHEPGAIYEAIKMLLQDDNKRFMLASNAREDIQQMFTGDKLGDEFVKFYNEAIAKYTGRTFS